MSDVETDAAPSSSMPHLASSSSSSSAAPRAPPLQTRRGEKRPASLVSPHMGSLLPDDAGFSKVCLYGHVTLAPADEGDEGQTLVNHLTDEEVGMELLEDGRLWHQAHTADGGVVVSDSERTHPDSEVFELEAREKNGVLHIVDRETGATEVQGSLGPRVEFLYKDIPLYGSVLRAKLARLAWHAVGSRLWWFACSCCALLHGVRQDWASSTSAKYVHNNMSTWARYFASLWPVHLGFRRAAADKRSANQKIGRGC
jgi:hypothetical protein